MFKFGGELITLLCDVCHERPGEQQVERNYKWLLVCRECLTDAERERYKLSFSEKERERFMCELKGGPCIQERLEAEGKAKGPCYCILKQAKEKKDAVYARLRERQIYEAEHPEAQFNELKARTLKRSQEELSSEGV